MLEQAREIVRRFNLTYGETLVEPEALVPQNQVCCRLPRHRRQGQDEQISGQLHLPVRHRG